MVVKGPISITANEESEVFGGTIILVNPTDCCTPTIKIRTPWGDTGVSKIKIGNTITFRNLHNPNETFAIKSKGESIQYAVPGSGYLEDTIKSVSLIITYIISDAKFPVEVRSVPPGAQISIK